MGPSTNYPMKLTINKKCIVAWKEEEAMNKKCMRNVVVRHSVDSPGLLKSTTKATQIEVY